MYVWATYTEPASVKQLCERCFITGGTIEAVKPTSEHPESIVRCFIAGGTSPNTTVRKIFFEASSYVHVALDKTAQNYCS